MKKMLSILCSALFLNACTHLNVAYKDKENKEEWYQLTVECLDEFYSYPAVSNKMSSEEYDQYFEEKTKFCKETTKELIKDKKLPNVDECDKDECFRVAALYYLLINFELLINLEQEAEKELSISRSYFKTSLSYAKKGCELGNGRACEFLSVVYQGYFDEDLKINIKDTKRARQYYKKSIDLFKKDCDFNDAQACHKLGHSYIITLVEYGVIQDNFMASKYYKKACGLGKAEWCNMLGVLYRSGEGVKKSLKTAKEYFGKACDLGYERGCENYNKISKRDIILNDE